VLALALLPAGRVEAATLGPPADGQPAPAPAAAAKPADVEVDEHVAQGHRLYQLGRYQEAIAEYRRAYELRAEPQFLFQIAESYRQLGASEQALFYYDRYLAGAPTGADRDTAEERVTELESLRARPPSPTTPGLVGTPGPGPTEGAKKQPKPLWRRWWLWTAIGVAVAAGATAAALSGRSETPVPSTALGNKGFF